MRRRALLQLAAAAVPLSVLPVRSRAAVTGSASLYEPTRFAFVADRFTNFITVVDIHSGERVEVMNFGIRPQVFEMARDDSMMAVGALEVPAVHLHDLRTRETFVMPLPSPVYQLFFIPQSKLLAVGMRDQVGIIDYEKRTLKVFAQKFDSSRRDTHINTYYSLLFSSFSQSFWVLDEDRPRILRQRGTEPADSPWEIIDFSEYVASGSGLGIGVASPEDFMIAFTVDDGSQGLVYFPGDGKVLSTGPMRTVGTTNEPLIMPYIDAYSGRVLFADVEGNVALFDFNGQDESPQRFRVDFSPRILRSGWLESTWILGGDRALLFQSFDHPEQRTVYRFPDEVMNIWVTGDSKMALVTRDEDVSQLYRYDIRSHEMLDPIRLSGVVMGGKIRMGSNNSICY